MIHSSTYWKTFVQQSKITNSLFFEFSLIQSQHVHLIMEKLILDQASFDCQPNQIHKTFSPSIECPKFKSGIYVSIHWYWFDPTKCIYRNILSIESNFNSKSKQMTNTLQLIDWWIIHVRQPITRYLVNSAKFISQWI